MAGRAQGNSLRDPQEAQKAFDPQEAQKAFVHALIELLSEPEGQEYAAFLDVDLDFYRKRLRELLKGDNS